MMRLTPPRRQCHACAVCPAPCALHRVPCTEGESEPCRMPGSLRDSLFGSIAPAGGVSFDAASMTAVGAGGRSRGQRTCPVSARAVRPARSPQFMGSRCWRTVANCGAVCHPLPRERRSRRRLALAREGYGKGVGIPVRPSAVAASVARSPNERPPSRWRINRTLSLGTCGPRGGAGQRRTGRTRR
jgi:hypothetical protein